jgi:hypothetical protein
MGLKPIPLSAYTSSFTPPVTGVNGMLAPVANMYDSSGHFESRSRSGSGSKRKRTEELDAVYDLSEEYPPTVFPEKKRFDLSVVKEMVLAAGVASKPVRDMLDAPDLDPKMKAFATLNIALYDALEAVLESGLAPISGTASRGSFAGRQQPPPPPPKPVAPPGLKELREGLEKAEKECVLFGADLGPMPVANRNALSGALTACFKKCAVINATEKNTDLNKAIRDMDDALSCVSDMEFLGAKSKKFLKEGDTRSNTFCTMPVKFRFEDKHSRINFEKTLRAQTGLRATISIPAPIRDEMKAMKAALCDRYPGEIVVVRLDTATAELKAIRKVDKADGWMQCWERFALPRGILLPGYSASKVHQLPPAVSVAEIEQHE